jgi:hypothetical protein
MEISYLASKTNFDYTEAINDLRQQTKNEIQEMNKLQTKTTEELHVIID